MEAPRSSHADQPAPRRRVAHRGARPISKVIEAMLEEPVSVNDAGEPVSRAEQVAARLVELATDPDPTVSLRAINMLMERVEGRPFAVDGRMDPEEVRETFHRTIRAFLNFVPEDRHTDLFVALDRAFDGMAANPLAR